MFQKVFFVENFVTLQLYKINISNNPITTAYLTTDYRIPAYAIIP